MKLATLKSNSRDGKLCLVSQNLEFISPVDEIAPTLQYALENWSSLKDRLQAHYQQLNAHQLDNLSPFDSTLLESPLPRAYQWADGSAYVNHVELVRKARGAIMPENFWTSPLMYQGGSDSFIGPNDPILVAEEAYGIDYEAEIAVITDDVPMGIDEESALSHIKLIMLVNDVSLRNLIPEEIGKGFGFFHSKPASSFSPTAITPDELGDAFREGKVHLPLVSHINGIEQGRPNAGVDMTFNFGRLISHAAKTRDLIAGSIIGSGTVSNLDRTLGSSCLAEKRMLETIETGKPKTPFMSFGDVIKIEMFDKDGANIFGSIEQTIEKAS
jgi:fumarylacetoacetate (FAA) hydrolase